MGHPADKELYYTFSIKQWKDFTRRLKEYLREYGIFYVEPLSHEYIQSMYEHQGFFSGIKWRVYYDSKVDKFFRELKHYGM